MQGNFFLLIPVLLPVIAGVISMKIAERRTRNVLNMTVLLATAALVIAVAFIPGLDGDLTVFHFHAGLDEDDILGGNAGQTEHDLFDFIGGDDFDEDILGDGEDDDEFDLDDIMGAIEVDDSMSNADLLHDTFDSDDEI